MENNNQTKKEKSRDFKFKLKIYFIYLFLEPVTSKLKFPNLRTLSWTFIVLAIIFRYKYLEIVFAAIGVLMYMIYEFREGKYLYWYRMRKYKDQREALKKVREERKLKALSNPTQTESNQTGLPQESHTSTDNLNL